MKRHDQILLGALIVQVILIIFVFWPQKPGSAAGEPVFPDLDANDVVAVSITDDVGSRIFLRQETGQWVLPGADDYPAAGDKVVALLEKLAQLSTGRLVTRTDASHKPLQVSPDQFMRRIQLELADGSVRILYLGSSPSYGAMHFRVEGRNETYLTDEITVWDASTTVTSWVDVVYQQLAQDEITAMVLENAQGRFAFTRDEAGDWTMDGLAADEVLNDTQVATLLRQATTVSLVRPLGREPEPAYGMDGPNAVVTLERAGGTVTLSVGAKSPEDNTYVVRSSESPYYVRVAEYGVSALVENGREDFIQLPPTPTPEGAEGDS
ncbi:MAG TPA: DUF4340 domain-containing protein [Chloroflexi bacterium]|nr:DUF4340 domain-containing protein [Chloroflexota bacterium]